MIALALLTDQEAVMRMQCLAAGRCMNGIGVGLLMIPAVVCSLMIDARLNRRK